MTLFDELPAWVKPTLIVVAAACLLAGGARLAWVAKANQDGVAAAQIEIGRLQAVNERLAANLKAEREWRAGDDQAVKELREHAAGTDARGRDLAHRLLACTSEVHADPVPGSGVRPGSPPASGKPSGPGPIEQATAEYDAACQRDGARLDKLIERIHARSNGQPREVTPGAPAPTR